MERTNEEYVNAMLFSFWKEDKEKERELNFLKNELQKHGYYVEYVEHAGVKTYYVTIKKEFQQQYVDTLFQIYQKMKVIKNEK